MRCSKQPTTPQLLCRFITLRHDPAALQSMNRAIPSVLAKDGGSVVGYVIMMPTEWVPQFPLLVPMLDMLNGITRAGVALQDNDRW